MKGLNYKKTLISIILTVLGAGLFLANPVFAQSLTVEFEDKPLFDEANFLPGQAVTRWVKVTNNSDSSQRIATEAINISDPDRLGDVLNLEIKEGSTVLYNNPLSTFFNAGEVFLSDLTGNGGNTQYDFSVSFYPGTNNNFQDKSLSFDILVGFQGTEGGLLPGAGGGGGGFLPPGLTISNEADRNATENSVTITWQTNYFSTSQVIYDIVPGQFDLSAGPPKYGYTYTTPEYDTNPKVTGHHSVTITGLASDTTYYFRCVSHGSLAIGTEHSFTTLVGTGEEEVEEEIEEEEEEEMPGPVIPGEEEEEEEEEEDGEITEGPTEGEGAGVGETTLEDEEEVLTEEGKGVVSWFSGGLASMIDALRGIGERGFLYLIIILILIFIILILLYLLLKKKKKKEEEEENKSRTTSFYKT